MTFLVKRSDRTLATCLINPKDDGKLSINTSNAKAVDITEFTGLFVDSYTDPENPTVEFIAFPAQTFVVDTSVGVGAFIYARKDGVIVEELILQQGAYLRENISLGVVQFTTGGDLTSATSPTQVTSVSAQLGFADLSAAMAPIDTATGGNTLLSGRAGTLEVIKGAGEYYNHAFNARNSDGNLNPNFVSSPETTTPFIISAWRSTGSPNNTNITVGIEVLKLWDDGTATSSDPLPQGVLGDDEWVTHRIHEVANQAAEGNQPIIIAQIGRQKYPSKFAAIHGLQTETAEVVEQAKATPVIGTVTLRGGATDLTDECDAVFRKATPPRSFYR